MTTIALKAQLRGAAYSWEEAGVDVAVGAVDAAMSAATAGLSKGLARRREGGPARRRPRPPRRPAASASPRARSRSWLKEAMKEAVRTRPRASRRRSPSAILDDNTWKSGDPWGHIASATGQGAAMGAGMGVAHEGRPRLGGAAWGKIKGGAKAEPRIEAHAPGDPGAAPERGRGPCRATRSRTRRARSPSPSSSRPRRSPRS